MKIDQFWKSVVRQDDGCWVWNGLISFGSVRVNGVRGAGRISYIDRLGFIVGRIEGCKKNSMCVKPDHLVPVEFKPVHLRAGGRQKEIERLWREGVRIKDIADFIGCSRQTVSRRLKQLKKIPICPECNQEIK